MSGAALAPVPTPTPSQRSEVLALVSGAASAQCDRIELVAYGEVISRVPLTDAPERICVRLLDAVISDVGERDYARHSYSIVGFREDREITRTTLRVRGGGQVEPGGVLRTHEVEPTTSGALKAVLRQNEQLSALLVKSQHATLALMGTELERAHRRVAELENKNDAMRADLISARDGTRAEELRAQVEAQRAAVLRQLGAQLIKIVPWILRKWFPELPPDVLGNPAPSAIARAIASVTDVQIAELGGALSAEQLEVIQRARAGGDLTVADLAPFQSLTSEALQRLPAVLRHDQLEPLLSALEASQQPPGASSSSAA